MTKQITWTCDACSDRIDPPYQVEIQQRGDAVGRAFDLCGPCLATVSNVIRFRIAESLRTTGGMSRDRVVR